MCDVVVLLRICDDLCCLLEVVMPVYCCCVLVMLLRCSVCWLLLCGWCWFVTCWLWCDVLCCLTVVLLTDCCCLCPWFVCVWRYCDGVWAWSCCALLNVFLGGSCCWLIGWCAVWVVSCVCCLEFAIDCVWFDCCAYFVLLNCEFFCIKMLWLIVISGLLMHAVLECANVANFWCMCACVCMWMMFAPALLCCAVAWFVFATDPPYAWTDALHLYCCFHVADSLKWLCMWSDWPGGDDSVFLCECDAFCVAASCVPFELCCVTWTVCFAWFADVLLCLTMWCVLLCLCLCVPFVSPLLCWLMCDWLVCCVWCCLMLCCDNVVILCCSDSACCCVDVLCGVCYCICLNADVFAVIENLMAASSGCVAVLWCLVVCVCAVVLLCVCFDSDCDWVVECCGLLWCLRLCALLLCFAGCCCCWWCLWLVVVVFFADVWLWCCVVLLFHSDGDVLCMFWCLLMFLCSVCSCVLCLCRLMYMMLGDVSCILCASWMLVLCVFFVVCVWFLWHCVWGDDCCLLPDFFAVCDGMLCDFLWSVIHDCWCDAFMLNAAVFVRVRCDQCGDGLCLLL